MTHNPDAQQSSAAQHQFGRARNIVLSVCGAVVLALLLWGLWRGVFSALWGQWVAFHQSATWDLLVGPTFVILAVLGLIVLWKGPKWQVAQVERLDQKERFDRENESRKTLATILGGIVLLTGGFFTWRNIKVAQESLRVSQESLRVSQEGQITDRFTKAIEQLGAVDATGEKKMVVRLGGIYALERIANESERDHWPIMEVLCTYVRNVAPVNKQESRRKKQASSPHPEADIQAILTVLGRRDTKYEKKNQSLDLSSSNLRGANLNDADLGGADLSGADLSGADLSEADLSGANLSAADLTGADLFGINLTEASGVTQSQIDQAKGGGSPKLPSDLRMPESWKK